MDMEETNVLLVKSGSEECESLRKKLEEEGVKDKFVILDIESEEGSGIAKVVGVEKAPKFVRLIEDKEKKVLTICKLTMDLELEECVEIEAKGSE